MRIVLAFEHIRRLVGAHSQIVTALGESLVARGHEVTILCDTVTDPALHPLLHFVARRTHQVGESHRLALLARWSHRVQQSLQHDITLSFIPAIRAPVAMPLLGWIGARLAHEHKALGRPIRHGAIQFHPNVIERRWFEATMRRDPTLQFLLAAGPHMAKALSDRFPELAGRVRLVPFASPIEPSRSIDEQRRLREEVRSSLRILPEDRVFLWAAKHALWHNRPGTLKAFAILVDAWRRTSRAPNRLTNDVAQARAAGRMRPDANIILAARAPRPILLLTGDSPWPAHQGAVLQNLDDHVRVIARTADMPALLSASDVVVNPALHSLLGRVSYEAIAFGRPVILSPDTGGVDLFRTGLASNPPGRVVDASDNAALARAMAELLDYGRFEVAAAAAREVAGHLNFTEFVSAIEAVLLDAFQNLSAKR